MNKLDPIILPIKEIESGPFFHLQQLYEFEFSFLTKNNVDKNGLYDQKSLQKSWNNHNYNAYLFIHDDIPIGFCVVNLNSQINLDPATKDIAEFFIMPNSRNKKYGTKLAHQIFNLYKEKWETRQLVEAVQARKFWLKAIHKYTQGNYEEFLIDIKGIKYYVQKFSRIKF